MCLADVEPRVPHPLRHRARVFDVLPPGAGTASPPAGSRSTSFLTALLACLLCQRSHRPLVYLTSNL